MEDEEGYTAFNLRPKQGGSGGPSPARNQGSNFNPLLPPTGSMSWQQGQSRGGSGCKLCPTDWQLRGDKCYWVSRGRKTWSESRTDCSARAAPAGLGPGCRVQGLIGHIVGLGLFLVSDPVENSCGAVWGKWIHSDACSSGLHWICRRDAVLL
uniref:Uncharacterized protein n=1 Tax=Chelonoidis abingdonii TaxID=106734 RepID=A0A8C0IPC4_CHEAB